MSKSRFIKSFAEAAGFIGGYCGLTFWSMKLSDKRYAELRQRHPNANIEKKFHYYPGVGGYTSWEINNDTKPKKRL